MPFWGHWALATLAPISRQAIQNGRALLRTSFYADAAEKVRHAGGKLSHVDVTLICESPKITPHRNAMCTEIAKILGLSADRVSVKATTTEGLGFPGRGEGIAAMASATLYLP